MTLTTKEKASYLRRLPQVGEVLESLKASEKDPIALKDAVRGALDELRDAILAAEDHATCRRLTSAKAIHRRIDEAVTWQMTPALRPVVNGTGVILHTNLGRALLSQRAADNVRALSTAYGNLEYDLDRGTRGSRHSILASLLKDITGAEDAMVVNNNAAAVLLAISALTDGGEVVVSRGELVEIGGSFRVPEIIELSGARLKEIGTTNKVHAYDYEKAARAEEAQAILKVHRSNFKIVGFTEEVDLAELRAIADAQKLPLIYDLGSGLMHDLSDMGVTEPTVPDALAAGADLVLFSGDKLLGGPQAGIAVGKKEYIEAMKRHPLARAVRMDKMNFAALEATLESYRNPLTARREIPVLAMLTKPAEAIKKEAEALAEELNAMGFTATVEPDKSQVGGGSCPGESLDTFVVAVASEKFSAAEMEAALRRYNTPIILRIAKDRILIDPRTLQPGDDEIISDGFKSLR